MAEQRQRKIKFSDRQRAPGPNGRHAEAPPNCKKDAALFHGGIAFGMAVSGGGVCKHSPTDCGRRRLNMKRRTEEISSVMTTIITTVLIMTRLAIPAKDFTVWL